MLKSINGILKTMGTALAFANAAEMLSEKQKNRVLMSQQKHPSAAADKPYFPAHTASDENFAIESIDSAITPGHS